LKNSALFFYIIFSCFVFGTNGYFDYGYGIKGKGMGGASISCSASTLCSATNPATMSLLNNRIDLGGYLFRPFRSATIEGTPEFMPGQGGFSDGNFESGNRTFLVPEFGYAKRFNERWVGGVMLYGNGGMNTSYRSAIPLLDAQRMDDPAYVPSPTYSNLEQLFLTLAAAYRFDERHTFGFSATMAVQRFEVRGLGNFAPFSQDPQHVTNQGLATSLGLGIQVGYLGNWTERFTFGATYVSKIDPGAFDEYRGLFAEEGSFAIPAHYGIGMNFRPVPELKMALDVVHIDYEGVPALANGMAALAQGFPLGSPQGPGFGWENMTVVKMGVNWSQSPKNEWRLGYNYGKQPIPSSEVLFNILAPAVVEHHFSGGYTRHFGAHELSLLVTFVPEETLSGEFMMMMGQMPVSGDVSLAMDQYTIGVGYGYQW
jgi:long-chain fatty acid transport protein